MPDRMQSNTRSVWGTGCVKLPERLWPRMASQGYKKCGCENSALLTDHYAAIRCQGEYSLTPQFAFEVVPLYSSEQ